MHACPIVLASSSYGVLVASKKRRMNCGEQEVSCQGKRREDGFRRRTSARPGIWAW